MRPLFSSGGDESTTGEAGAVDELPLEFLRKNGMPEGVRRGLSKLERERPGLVVTTAGVGGAEEEGTPLEVMPAVIVLLLL